MGFIRTIVNNELVLINTDSIQKLRLVGDKIICSGDKYVHDLVIYKGKHSEQIIEDIFETIGNGNSYDLNYRVNNFFKNNN